MREIKFRGYGKDVTGEHWIYGNLLDEKLIGLVAIQDEKCHVWEVDPESVGQYTGLKDADGREIYEGDIIASCFADYKAVVEFRNGAFVAVTGPVDTYQALCGVLRLKGLRVIGNIHDNPELMERKP